MKKLLLIAICLPFICLAQKSKPNGYGFIGAGMHFIEKSENIAGRFNIGILPTPNAGIGVDVQYIKDFGVPIMGDFRFISNRIGSTRLTVAVKAGKNFYDKPIVKGGFVYGTEAGLIFGKSKNGFYISAQYLSIQYNTKGVSYSVNDFGFTAGVKF